jgi:hypothetical protein
MELNSIFAHLEKTPNRGSVHLFLGHPAAELCDVTTVEPGNTYSPGMWTCGISFGIILEEKLILPDLLENGEIGWGFGTQDGLPPVVRAVYRAGEVTVTHDICHLGTEGAEGVDFNNIQLDASIPSRGSFCLVVRENGPAGGIIKELAWDPEKQALKVNHTLQITLEAPTCECLIRDEGEKMALIHAPFKCESGKPFEVRFKSEHGFDNRWFTPSIPKKQPFAGLGVKPAFEQVVQKWENDLPARLFAPDPRVAQVWESCAFHILNAMDNNLARIGAVHYPIFWLRDGIIILRALDLMGRHELAQIGCDYISPLIFTGGFGAESDAPGEGIWALTSHAKITNDFRFLREVYPQIRKRVDFLLRMISATEPLRMVTENRTASTYNTPAGTILCLPAQHGVIHGRMDGHSPDFYINCWALLGLSMGSWAAEKLGEAEGKRWQSAADQLEDAISRELLPVYGNERDPIVTPYPSGALSGPRYREALKNQFIKWYRANRLDEANQRKPELLWTYFEAAQIHNAILLGFKDEAWACLDGMLEAATSPWNISAWTEGPPGYGGLPFGNDYEAKGWLDKDRAIAGNMPHNWTSGEMMTMLRDLFVVEEGDALVLGKGVPAAWLKPGSRFGVKNLPTDLGLVSYSVEVQTNGLPKLTYVGPQNYQIAW